MKKTRTKHPKPPEPSAHTHLETARQYHLAATKLFEFGAEVEMPLYFLYTHTIELAFKAYLRSVGVVGVPEIHVLPALCELCREHGLVVNRHVKDVAQLLESENQFHGFRYYAFVSVGKPSLDYLRETVDELIAVIEEKVNNAPDGPLIRGQAEGILKGTVHKPEPKKK